MSKADEVQAIELNIKEHKKTAELGDAVERLRANRDFKKVVLEGYFEMEAIRLVHLKADPAMQSPERQASIVAQIDAIGAVSSYLDTIRLTSGMAKKAIAQDEAELEVLNGEDDINV